MDYNTMRYFEEVSLEEMEQLTSFPNIPMTENGEIDMSALRKENPELFNEQGQYIPHVTYNLPESYKVYLPTICFFEPMNKEKYPTITISIENIVNYKKKDGQVITLFYARLLTPPTIIDYATIDLYTRYKKAIAMGDSFNEDWHFITWAAPRWFAMLCGCPIDEVRAKIYNNSYKHEGGFEYYPLDFDKIKWIKTLKHYFPDKHNVGILCDPQYYGYIWTLDENNQLVAKGNKFNANKKIPSLWLNRAGSKVIEPDYPDGCSYAKFDLKELLPELSNLNVEFLDSVKITPKTVDLIMNSLQPKIKKMLEEENDSKRKRFKKKIDN